MVPQACQGLSQCIDVDTRCVYILFIIFQISIQLYLKIFDTNLVSTQHYFDPSGPSNYVSLSLTIGHSDNIIQVPKECSPILFGTTLKLN